MTGPEHYLEAERILAQAMRENDTTCAVRWAGEAQVHATLALAAATAMAADSQGMSSLDFEAWDAVCGVQEDDDPYDAEQAVDAEAFDPSTSPLAVAFGAAPAAIEYFDEAEADDVRAIRREMAEEAGDDEDGDEF